MALGVKPVSFVSAACTQPFHRARASFSRIARPCGLTGSVPVRLREASRSAGDACGEREHTDVVRRR